MDVKNNPPEVLQKDNKAKDIAALGRTLRDLREAQSISLDEASNATKIQKKYLHNIEEGRLDDLPKGPYCRSFLRQYCGYLNASDLWGKYDALTKNTGKPLGSAIKNEEDAPCAVSPGVFKKSSRLWIYAIIIISLSAAVGITLSYRGEITSRSTNPLEGGTAPAAEQGDAASSDAAEAVSDDSPVSVDLGWMDGKAPVEPVKTQEISKDVQPAAPVVKKTPVVKITPSGVVWVKASLGGKVIYEGLLKTNDVREYSPTEKTPLRLRYGNPAKTGVSWFGSETAPIGKDAKPITRYYWYDGEVTATDKRQ